MDPVTMAVIGGASEAMKTALGISQAIKANRIAKQNKRPEYQIPGAVKESVAMGRNLATQGLPGYATMQDQIGQQTASGVRAVKEAGGSGPEKLAAIAGMAGQAGQQARTLGVQNAQQRVANMGALQGQLGQLGQYQDKAWQTNFYQPYMDAMQAAQRLREGANQNIYGGLKGMASAGMMAGGGMGGGAGSVGDVIGSVTKSAPQTSKPSTAGGGSRLSNANIDRAAKKSPATQKQYDNMVGRWEETESGKVWVPGYLTR